MEGVFYVTWKVEVKEAVIQAALLAGKAYNATTKGVKNHGKGSPHAHQLAASLMKVQETTTDNSVKETIAKIFAV